MLIFYKSLSLAVPEENTIPTLGKSGNGHYNVSETFLSISFSEHQKPETYLHLSCHPEASRWVLVWRMDQCLSDVDICRVEDYLSNVTGNTGR